MDLNKLYKEIEEAEASLNAKRLEYIREALAENNGIIKLKFKGFKEFKETNDAFDFDDQFPVIIEIDENPMYLTEVYVKKNDFRVVLLDYTDMTFDGSFMHAICSNCENEVIISNIEEVKHEIDLRFHEFVEKTGKEPEYVECQIVWKKTGDEQRKTIKLSLGINDDDNDDVFYYCNGIESFKQLTEYGMGEFIVTFCWSFF